MAFKEIDVKELEMKPFKMIGQEWLLITAGDETGYNTMTASWGNLGIMWNKNIATVYIRPQRYTKQFVDSNDLFTISFYDSDMKDALRLCGTKSGRDCDKVKEAGLEPVFEDSTTYFKQAKLVLVCKKLYCDVIRPDKFVGDDGERWYPEKDYHYIYMAEVVKALKSEE